MRRRFRLSHRLAGVVAILVQLLLQTGIAWYDARAEGAARRQDSHVERLGAQHAQHAHAADCVVSQHLQSHSSPAARLRAGLPARAASHPLPPQPAAAPPRCAAAATLSRAPPRAL